MYECFVSLSINTSDEPIQEFFETSSVKQMYISRMCRCLPPIKTEIINAAPVEAQFEVK